MPAAKRNHHTHVGRQATSRRLRIQIVAFSLVFALVTILAVVRIIGDGINPLWPLVGFAAGLLIGALLVRTKSLGWDASSQMVVSSLSIGGIVVTIAYLVLMALRDRLLGAVIHDATTVAVVGMTITAGVMLGRVLVTVRDIRHILTDAGIPIQPE